ncbi:type II toxin-antitoxin system VapC family toxin [soil metagenome]
MGIVIDASVIVSLERRGALFDPAELGIEVEPVAITAMTASELLVGVHRADTAQRRDEREFYLETMFQRFQILPFDLSVARVHARIWSHLWAIGTPIGDRDLIIGTTALAHGYSVLTENTREFARIPDLQVLHPSW